MDLTIDQLIKNGNHYKNTKKYDAMKNCYHKAIRLNSDKAMYNLAMYYKNISDYNNMIKYYRMAVQNRNKDALSELIKYYKHLIHYYDTIEHDENKKNINYEEMKKYCLMAIDLGDIDAMKF